ncbi:hypothetical protein U1Q18_003483 [Sarracenia purpurea var. burkii]
MMQDCNITPYPTGFPFQELKPILCFSADLGLGNGSRFGNLHGEVQENGNGRLMFPSASLKQVSNSSTEVDQNKGQGNSTGYWNEVLGGDKMTS